MVCATGLVQYSSLPAYSNDSLYLYSIIFFKGSVVALGLLNADPHRAVATRGLVRATELLDRRTSEIPKKTVAVPWYRLNGLWGPR